MIGEFRDAFLRHFSAFRPRCTERGSITGQDSTYYGETHGPPENQKCIVTSAPSETKKEGEGTTVRLYVGQWWQGALGSTTNMNQ